MKDATLVATSAGQALLELLASIPAELRLQGLAPDIRLRGLAPEQRLAGLAPEPIAHALPPEDRLLDLTPAQAVLALPDALLRGLSADFIATLPDDIQRTVREGLAR